jgi:hypothetical protein
MRAEKVADSTTVAGQQQATAAVVLHKPTWRDLLASQLHLVGRE